MLHKTAGLVVRTVKYSDTSLIANIFTRELGMQQYMLKGVRLPKNRKNGNLIQPMQFLQMDVYKKENRNLQSIKEFRPSLVYQRLPFDVRRSAIGIFMLETIYNAVREEEENKPLFDFFHSWFSQLDNMETISPLFHMKYLLELSSHLGFYPSENYGEDSTVFDLQSGRFVGADEASSNTLNEMESAHFFRVLATSEEELDTVELNRTDRANLLTAIISYYKFHVLDFRSFRTPSIYKEVFGSTFES